MGWPCSKTSHPKKSKRKSKSKQVAGNDEKQCVLGGNESTGRQAPHTVLTKVELRWEAERRLGLPGWDARRT